MFGLPLTRNETIERTAADLSGQVNGGALPVQTRQLLAANGIIRIATSLDVDAVFDLRGKPPYTLFIDNKNAGKWGYERRVRFTEAHELGHYFLHDDAPELHRETGATVIEAAAFGNHRLVKQEIEANAFAGALLMPRDEFERDIANLPQPDGEQWRGALARKYDVSFPALDVRIARLRPGLVLSGHAWADTGNIISLVPTLEFERAEPEIADAAWRRNPVVQGYRLGRLPKQLISQIAAEMRQLSSREAACIKREYESFELSSILPEVEGAVATDLFICGCDRGGQKIYFEMAVLPATDALED